MIVMVLPFPLSHSCFSLYQLRFFDSQLQLFVELEIYLQKYHDGSDEYFPATADILAHGHTHLYELIRIHGGKTMLAQKLDMKQRDSPHHCTLSWGSFKLKFAIELLHFIRSQYLLLNPPLSSALISMPSEKDLHRSGRMDLIQGVIDYGGFESVARRLGLAYFDAKSEQMCEERFRTLKQLWKDRQNFGVLTVMKKAGGRKIRGLAWSESIVVEELNAYIEANNTKRSLPPTVMPLLRHLEEDCRGDLKRAIAKFGGTKVIGKKAGLIPFIEATT